MTRQFLKRIAWCFALATVSYGAKAQVKIGQFPNTIDPASILELENPNKALYLTRVALLNTSDMSTVPNPKPGMVVYNTNVTIGVTDPNYPASAGGTGVYYFNGTGWVSTASAVVAANYWQLMGNSGTNPANNYLGTSDNQPLIFRISGIRAGKLDQSSTSYGYQSQLTATGLNNTSVGVGSLKQSTGNSNTATGSSALFNNTSGNNNTATGNSALLGNQGGSNNTAIGDQAGMSNTTGSFNTLLGSSANVGAANLTNATAIGYNAVVNTSNSMVLGNGVNVGIGNSAPANTLHITPITGLDPLRVDNLNPGTVTDNVMTVDGTGVVHQTPLATLGAVITADNGLTKTANNIQLGGSLLHNTDITGGNFLTTFSSTSTANQTAGFNVTAAPGNAITSGNEIFGSNVHLEGSDGQAANVAGSETVLRAAVNYARTSGPAPNHTRAQGSLNQGVATGFGLGANLNIEQAIGATGLGFYEGPPGAAADDYIVGLLGTTISPSNPISAINLEASTPFGTYYRSVGGYFRPGGGSEANLGVVTQIGGTKNTGWKDAALTGKNISLVAVNTNAPGVNERAIYSTGAVQMIGLTGAGSSIVTTDGSGNLGTATAASLVPAWLLTGNFGTSTSNFIGTTDAQQFAIRTNNIQRGLFRADGSIAMGNSTPIYTDNKFEIDLQDVGGTLTTGEQNQGVNVLASSLNGSAQSTGLRSRMNNNALTTVGSLRGIQGNAGVDGTANGGVSGGYFNAVLRSTGILGANATVSGVSADAEESNAGPANAATNAFIGGRFGSNVPVSNLARTFGVFTTATNSATSNVGVLALVNDPAFAAYTTFIGAQLTGFSASLVGINPSAAANQYALSTSGSVRMSGLSGSGNNIVTIDPVTKILGSATPASLAINDDWKLQGNGNTDSATNFLGTTDFKPLSIRTDNTQRLIVHSDGRIAMGNSIVSPTTNLVQIDAINVGGASSEADQAFNVLARAKNATSVAIGLRGRISNNGTTTVSNIRGVSGAADVSGAVPAGLTTGATGGYFNANITNTGSLGSGAVLVGASADAEAAAGATAGNTNAFIGGRFGAAAANTPLARGVGVYGTSAGSTTSNTGVFGAVNATAAQVGAFAATQPAGFGASIVGYNPNGGANQYAGYFIGNNPADGAPALLVANTITANFPAGNNPMGGIISVSGTDGVAVPSGGISVITGLYPSATTTGNNVQTQASLSEATTSGKGLGGSGGGNFAQAVGAFGLADYTGNSNADIDDYITGSAGSPYRSSNAINGIGITGSPYNTFGYYRMIGGYFRADGATVDNGTYHRANLGMVSQVGGSKNQGWRDAAFNDKNIGVVAVNYNAASGNNLALYSSGAVQMTGLTGAGSSIVTTDGSGNLGTATAASLVPAWLLTGNFGTSTSNFIGTTDAQQFAIRTNNIQRGLFRADGSIAMGNSAPVYTSNVNAVEFSLQNVGSNIGTGEQEQGVNVISTAANGTSLSIALRSRLAVNAGAPVTQARGTSGNAIVYGTVSGTATGGYFNANLNGGTLGGSATLSGVAADAEATGTTSVNATNTLIGGRFGANAANATSARSVGVLASGANSLTSNVGILAIANDATFVSAPVVTFATTAQSAGVVALNPTTGGTNFALYSDGNVRMRNLSTVLAASLVGIDANGDLSKVAIPATITASNGVNRNVNNIELGGALTQATTAIGTDANHTLAVTGLQTGTIANSIVTVDGSGILKTLPAATFTAGNSWSLTGNAGTVDGTNFLGTTDGIPLTFRITSTNSGRIENNKHNTFLGWQAGFNNYVTNASANNTLIGWQAGKNITVNIGNTNNTAVGNQALSSTTSGTNNTGIGMMAGSFNSTGSNNTLLGSGADVLGNALSNASAIGFNAVVGASNSMVLGSINGAGSGTVNTNVGIGTTTPLSRMDVAASFGANITILSTATVLPLTDIHYTVIVTNTGASITFPPTIATTTRRIYNLVNTTGSIINTGTYINYAAGGSTNTIPANSKITIQSDGLNWYRID